MIQFISEFGLPKEFSKKKKFDLLVGMFIPNDEWKNKKEGMTFLTKEQVMELFKDYEIIDFKEVEKDGTTALGKEKHWHIFNIIAKK